MSEYQKLIPKEDWESLDYFLKQRKINIRYKNLNDHLRIYTFSEEERKKLPYDHLGFFIEINGNKRCLYKIQED